MHGRATRGYSDSQLNLHDFGPLDQSDSWNTSGQESQFKFTHNATTPSSFLASSSSLLRWAARSIRSRSASSVESLQSDHSVVQSVVSDTFKQSPNSSVFTGLHQLRGFCILRPMTIFCSLVVLTVLYLLLIASLPSAESTSAAQQPLAPVEWANVQHESFKHMHLLSTPDTNSSGCASGHLKGYDSVCDNKGCLRRLEPSHRVVLPRPEPFTPHLRNEIIYVPGYVHPLQMNIVTALTNMQWQHDVYGSVGEVGVHLGKYMSILAFNYHQDAGEKLFLSDNLSQLLAAHYNNPRESLDTFKSLMARRGFTFTPDDASLRRLYIHDGTHLELDKGILLAMDIPQFRLFSIGKINNLAEVLQIIERSVCFLREGGFLVIDGIHQPETTSRITSIIGKFLQRYTHLGLMPFLAAKNKLYMCTSDWRGNYTRYLLNQQSIIRSLGISGITDSRYGYQYTYFRIE